MASRRFSNNTAGPTGRPADVATVDRLVATLTPVRPRKAWRDALWLAALAAVELTLVVSLQAPRPDLSTAMAGPMFWWKLASCVGIAAAGAAALLAVLSPDAKTHAGRRGMVGAAGLAGAIGLVLIVIRTLPASVQMTLDWREDLACVGMVELYALPMAVAALWLARRAAPANPRAAALAAGVLSAAWGAALFVWWCPHDDPLYIVVWYGLALALGAGAAWMLLPRFLRW